MSIIKCDASVIEPHLYYIVNTEDKVVMSKGYARIDEADDEAASRWGALYYVNPRYTLWTGNQVLNQFY